MCLYISMLGIWVCSSFVQLKGCLVKREESFNWFVARNGACSHPKSLQTILYFSQLVFIFHQKPFYFHFQYGPHLKQETYFSVTADFEIVRRFSRDRRT